MADEVRKRSAAAEAMGADWPMIDALLGGTRTMRAAGKTYLPQWPNEDKESYETRLKTATLFNAFGRTIEILSAKPFSKPLTLGDDVPQRIRGSDTDTGWAEDIDLQGRSLHSFAADLVEQALSHGLSGILVEYPKVRRADPNDTRPLTQAEEQAAGVRPYWVQIHPQQLLGWKAKRENGQWTLLQLRFVEVVTEDSGTFGEQEVEQVRVLEPGKWATYRKRDKADKADQAGSQWQLHEEGTTTLSKVPFVPVYGQRTGFMSALPPLVDLAYMNVKHWQSQSDQDTILHMARVPILFAAGFEADDEITVGASAAVKTPRADAKLSYVEHGGAAIDAGKESLQQLEDQMRQAGAELLVIKPGNTSVSQTLADNEQGKCALQRIVEDAEDAIDQALQLTAEWVKEASGGHATLFKDFGALTLAEASLDVLQKAAAAGQLSNETFFTEAQRRGALSPDLKWEEEQERIERQGPNLGTPSDPD